MGTLPDVGGGRACFCAVSWCCDQDTQYFGAGTRLTVLGKRGSLGDPEQQWGRSEMSGMAGPVFVLCPGAVTAKTRSTSAPAHG